MPACCRKKVESCSYAAVCTPPPATCCCQYLLINVELLSLTMATTTDGAKPYRIVERTIDNVRINGIMPRAISSDGPTCVFVRCHVHISEDDVRDMVHKLYPEHDPLSAKCVDFMCHQIVSRDVIIRVPFADNGKLTSAETFLSDVLDEGRLELRGTFSVSLLIAMENLHDTEVIRSAAVSGITRTTEHMRYMTDETFPYYVLRGYDISHDDLDEFMNTY